MESMATVLWSLTIMWMFSDGGGGGGPLLVKANAFNFLSFRDMARRHDQSRSNLTVHDQRPFLARSTTSDWRRQALRLLDITDEQTRGTWSNNCSRVSMYIPDPYSQFHKQFVAQLQMASQFVSLIQNTLELSAGEAGYHERLYGSFAKALVESDPLIEGCAIYLRFEDDTESGVSVPHELIPYAYCINSASGCKVYLRNLGGEGDHVLVNNVSSMGGTDDQGSPVSSLAHSEPQWRTIVANYRHTLGNRSTNIASNSSSSSSSSPSSSTPSFREIWGQPWYNCRENSWSITYSFPLFSNERWRGALMVNTKLGQLDINQCDESEWLFGGTDLCHRETMQCVHHKGEGFRRGSYHCECRPGFYLGNDTDALENMEGSTLESSYGGNGDTKQQHFGCLPCKLGCYQCQDDSPCYVEYNFLMRSVPLGLQSFCMTITVVMGISVFQLRKCKVIATGMWTVLEMILVGAFFIYSTVVIRYFEPLTLGCLVEPWLREMGFAICYGTIVLKLYRVLVEFRTRKAHRWVIRDKDLLKYLMGIILVVIAYMAAWTAISVDHIREGDSVIDVGQTDQNLKYTICKSRWWDYVTEIGEFVFLAFAVYITYHIRNASSHYNEKRFLCLSVYIETLVSSALHIFRHGVWLNLHPDYIFLLYFIRCQLTVSITLILVFGPKFWYHYRPPQDTDAGGNPSKTAKESQDRLAAEMLKLQDGITSNGEVDIGEINLADMDPEDIRAELRRVYTQLQVLRNKTMRKDNPHISKRRGGRKATHRRFSLQAFHRHRHHHDPEHETEISKTPEESTGSADVGGTASVTEPVVVVTEVVSSGPNATTAPMRSSIFTHM